MASKVLFVSQNKLGRGENITALYNSYDGDKTYKHGLTNMLDAELKGYDVVVCDALPQYIAFKDKCKSIVICHGMTGNKVYGADEDRDVDIEAFQQTDIATAASKASIPIVAQQLRIPENRVKAIGFPRTDTYIGKKKGEGFTKLGNKRAYLFAPTFRDADKGGWIPWIDWEIVDNLLEEDEIVAVKRHYFTDRPLLGANFKRVIEIEPDSPLTPYLIDCDVLITDYSSCMTDGYLLGKPCILTVDDMDEYLAERPMYYPYPDTYSSRWIVGEGHEEELVKMMREAASNGLTDVEKHYMELTASECDGHSIERTCALIKEMANG